MKYIVVIAILIVFIVAFSSCSTRMDNETIRSWHAERGETISSSELCLFSTGPYWVSKNRRIYQVFTTNGKEYWWRFGGFWTGPDVEESTPTGYIKRQ